MAICVWYAHKMVPKNCETLILRRDRFWTKLMAYLNCHIMPRSHAVVGVFFYLVASTNPLLETNCKLAGAAIFSPVAPV